MEREPLEVRSEEIILRGELMSPAGCDTLIVLCHGIPLSLPDPSDGGYPLLMSGMARKGFASLFFNLRGTGDSGGDFHLSGWYADLEAVMGFVQEKLSSWFSRVILAGFSAGGALSIRYAAENGYVNGVASLAAPARFDNLFTREGLAFFVELARGVGIIRDPDFPGSLDSFYQEIEENGAMRFVSGVSPIPLLLVHGENDELVPAGEAVELFQAAGEPKRLVLVPGGFHRLRKDVRALDSLTQWAGELT